MRGGIIVGLAVSIYLIDPRFGEDGRFYIFEGVVECY